MTTLYAFTPPPGSAGRRVEIVYRAWIEGVDTLDLRLAVDIRDPISACAVRPSATTGTLETQARLFWSSGRPISWDDFWAPPPPDRDPQAAAVIAMVLEYQMVTAVVQEGSSWRARVDSLAVTAAMERDRSWALPDRRTPAGLLHEQRHFDLAEAYRRFLERSLQGIAGIGGSASEARQSLLRTAESVFQEVMGRHSAAQAQYDRETSHGRDAARQDEWDRKISSFLLDPYLRLP